MPQFYPYCFPDSSLLGKGSGGSGGRYDDMRGGRKRPADDRADHYDDRKRQAIPNRLPDDSRAARFDDHGSRRCVQILDD